MTYKELYESAIDKLEKSKITLGEFEKMIEPLNAEVATDTNVGDKDKISRQAAIDGRISIQRSNGVEVYYDEAVPVEYLKRLPSAQPERIRGRWIYTGVKFPNWEGQAVSEVICSECNGISYFRRAFDKYIGANICPNCGADMSWVTI